jgi:hypothetical protein
MDRNSSKLVKHTISLKIQLKYLPVYQEKRISVRFEQNRESAQYELIQQKLLQY